MRAIMNNERGRFLDVSTHELTADDVSTPSTHAIALKVLQLTVSREVPTRPLSCAERNLVRDYRRSLC